MPTSLPTPLNDDTALMYQQTIAKSNQLWMAQADRENHGMGLLSEQVRIGFQEMKVSNDIASNILNQRSVQQQPGVGVIPAAAPVSIFSPGATPASGAKIS